MSISQKMYVKKLLVLLLVFAVFLVSMPGFVGAVTGPEYFESGSSSLVIETQLTGGSTNQKTFPARLWVNGDTLFASVRSTHQVTNMTIGTVASYEFLRFAAHELIYIDGVSYDPRVGPTFNGNDKDAHWTVFKFNTSDLVSSGSGQYPVTVTSSVGGGHEINNNNFITITVPYVSATVTKIWIGGPMNPITIQLYKESPTTPEQSHGALVPLSADINNQANHTWNPLPYTDDFGSVLHYFIEEPSGGSGYSVDFDDNYILIEDDTDPALIGRYSWTLTNTYEASGSLDLSGMKSLIGRDLADKEFEFELYNGEELLETASNDINGNFSFPTLNYKLKDVGTKTYTVVETNGGETLDGVIYDDTEYTIEVTISDNDEGELNIDVAVDGENVVEGAVDFLNFTNTYTATGTLELSGTKILSGRTLAADEFTFELYEGEDTTVDPIKEAFNNTEGKYSFTLEYDLDDLKDEMDYPQILMVDEDVITKTYTVKEKVGSLGGVDYDDTEYIIEVTISDNDKGELNIDVAVDGEKVIEGAVDFLNFTNTYTATGTLELSGNTELTGRSLAPEEFEIELYEGETLLETVKNDNNGDFSFTKLKYDLDDLNDVEDSIQAFAANNFITKNYIVKQIIGDLGGVDYDETEYTLVVTISDKGDGDLNIDVTGGNPTSLDFTNTYTATGTLELSGTKTLTGRDLASDEFEFGLYDDEDELMEMVSHGGDGNFRFDTLEYDLDDVETKVYTVREILGDLSDVTYDATVYTLTVNISDNGDGTLNIDVTGANPTELDFANTYLPQITITTDPIPGAEPTITPPTIPIINVTGDKVPLAEPTTIKVVTQSIPKAGESGPMWPIGLALLALAGGISFIVHRSDKKNAQKEKTSK